MNTWTLAELRLSEHDRRSALRRLSREHRRGRITAAELEERTDAVGTARTHGDLGPVFADLGGNGLSHPRGRGPAAFLPFGFPLAPLLLIGIVLAVTDTIPWLPVLILGGLVLLLGPVRHRRWAGHHGYPC